MKNLFYPITFLLLVFLFACKEKNHSIYENCCGTEPTVDAVLLDNTILIDTVPDYGKVYIPNIFTPGPPATLFGFYSTFIVLGNAGVTFALSEVFSDENGEVLFSRDSFQLNDGGSSWNGQKPDGNYYYGPFNYSVKVQFVDGQIKIYNGKACSYKCGDSDFPSERLPDCFFPEQNNGNGEPDQSRPLMNDCF